MSPSTAAAAPWVVDDLAPIDGPENDKDDAHSSIDEHILPGAALNGPNSHIAASLRWVNRNLRCGSSRLASVAGKKRLVPRVHVHARCIYAGEAEFRRKFCRRVGRRP